MGAYCGHLGIIFGSRVCRGVILGPSWVHRPILGSLGYTEVVPCPPSNVAGRAAKRRESHRLWMGTGVKLVSFVPPNFRVAWLSF